MDSCGGRRFGSSLVFLRAMGLVNASSASNSCSVVQSEHTGVVGGQSSSRMASSWTDNKKEVAFASILFFVGLAALYPALKLANSPEFTHTTESSKNMAISPKRWVSFPFEDSQRLTHDTRLFRFLIESNMSLGLRPGSHLLTRAEIGPSGGGRPEKVVRAYTPISDPHAKGYFDLLIKVIWSWYVATDTQEDSVIASWLLTTLIMVYPEGMMSRHIAQLNPGDTLDVRGPVGELQYKANMKRYLGLIAGDIGIAPMLPWIYAIMSNPKDYTQVSLLYSTDIAEEVLLKDKLDELAAAHPNFKVFYTVDIANKGWKGGKGYISQDMIVKGLPHPSEDTLILIAGSAKMMDRLCGDKAKERWPGQVTGLLRELGYRQDQVHKFW